MPKQNVSDITHGTTLSNAELMSLTSNWFNNNNARQPLMLL